MSKFLGYAHPDYARSLSEFGSPRFLPESKGWILEREIPGFDYKDAMGCYPVFACQNWYSIKEDLQVLENNLVSLALVTDPFGNFDIQQLSEVFETFIEFKNHYISDLSEPIESFVRKKTQYQSLKALEKIQVEHCEKPYDYSEDWISIYDHLILRHQLKGIHRFSRKYFKQLLFLPEIDLFLARYDKQIVGGHIWIRTKEVGYSHLLALTPLGYKIRAGYALNWASMQYFSGDLLWLDFGGLPGTGQIDDKRAEFKRGWASGVKPVYFCGRILNQEIYRIITKNKGIYNTNYFPAYRAGEFS
ncbi:hypothetical protein JW926_14090 [Candidatus Sumerlaeota bacterium]|nr:hypothetical protein [Candidatus Sumerlaeota bacterium]